MSAKPGPKLYQLMAERIQDYAIFLLDPKGRIISWNAGAANIKRYHASEIIGQHFSIFYTPADIARDWPTHELRRALLEGRFEDEGWRVRKDGSRFWANVIITALRDDAGTLLAYSKVTRDLTERKNQEESLRLSEERFRLLVEGVQDYAIYMLNPEGLVSSWNLGARRIKGYEASEIIGKHFSRFYGPEDIELGKPWAELASAREHGNTSEEGWRVRKDGSKFWARVAVTALYDAHGRLHGFAKVTQDMTQQRHAQALELSSTQVNAFIAVLAHELRNPLAAIRNAVHLQSMTDAGDKVYDSARQIIDRQSAQLTRMVDDLLDISRITRGALSVDQKPCDIATIVDRSAETSRPAIEAGKHVLTIDLPSQPLYINGDELRLAQALTNIINNAARYTDPGGHIFVKAYVSEHESHSSVCVSVRDTGRGIEPNLLNSVFGMFVQGKNLLNRPAAGLGVGLALARSIVELHNGTVEAKSAGVGKGAEFIVTLPCIATVPATDSLAIRESVPPIVTHVPDTSRCRILVVDDNVDAATALASLLMKHGHGVLAVHNGVEALQVFEEFHPEIVLLDLGMPGMSGLDVARRLRQRNTSPRPLIIAVTGWGQHNDETRSREAGFDLHLVKPVEEPKLLEVLGLHSRSIH